MAAQEKRKEFCAILGVDEQASKEEIKKAYKQLALQCHPDKNQLNPEATQEFQKISEAYTGLCHEDMDSAEEEDINDFDGGVSLLELLQLFFKMNSRRKPFFMRSPSSWFSRYSEDSDEVNDSDDACGPVRQNIRNHSGQQSWNEDNHFVPGNARPQSSSKESGKPGKAKKRKNRGGGGRGGNASTHNNNNPGSDRQGTTGAGMQASTGSNTGASTNVGNSENRTSGVIPDGLATEATSENQLPGRTSVNDQTANQGSGGEAKSGFVPEWITDNGTNSPGENPERRGSNGSLRGTAQISQGLAAEKKPSKKKLQAEQRIREKEYAEIHRAVLEKNQREEEKRKKKADKERAKLDTEFMPKANAVVRDENKPAVDDCVPKVDPSVEGQDDRPCTLAEMNDAKDPETSDTASLDSDARFLKQVDGGLSLASSETIDSIGIDVTNNNVQPSDNRKASIESYEDQSFNKNRPEIACNGDAVGSNQNERQTFTRIFYGHSSKNPIKNNRFNRNFDNADGGNATGSYVPPQTGYRSRTDNANYRPHASNSSFVDRSFYRGFHNNTEREDHQNNDDCTGSVGEEANSNAGFKDVSGRGNQGQYGRGRYRGNRIHPHQTARFRNAPEHHESKPTDRDGTGLDSNRVVALDMTPSGERISHDATPNNLPDPELQSQGGTDELGAPEALPCNGHKRGNTQDGSDTSKRGYWPRSNRNFKGQRGNFRGGFDGGCTGRNTDDPNHSSGSFHSKQESWDSEESKSHVDRFDISGVEMPGKGQHRGRRPGRGGFQRGGGRVFNFNNVQENWDLEADGSRSGNQVDSMKEIGNESYHGGRPDRGPFPRGGRGRGRAKGFGQARDGTGEVHMRGNRAANWEPGKKHFDRGYDRDEYNGATMQFHRRKQTPGEAVPVPVSANNTVQGRSQSEPAAVIDGTVWTSRLSESHPEEEEEAVSGPRNVWKDRKEFYEGALPRNKEEEDDMLNAALKLSELEIEERRLAEQMLRTDRSLSFSSISGVGRSSEGGWTADVLDVVTVDSHPPRHQRPAENTPMDDTHMRLQPDQSEEGGKSTGVTADQVEEGLMIPVGRLKSWADEMEETNDTGGNDSLAEPDTVRSPHPRGGMPHGSWALMNFSGPSGAVGAEEAKSLLLNLSESEIKDVASAIGGYKIAHSTAPSISPLPVTQPGVSDGVVRPVASDQLCAGGPLRRQTSMLDDIDDGVEEERQWNMPDDGIRGSAAAATAVDSRASHSPPFPSIARHLPEAENTMASDVSIENNRREAVSGLPESPSLPCPAFPPGPMPPHVPWMQPGCPTYFFAMPGYPPWYPMPPYQHYQHPYWPCMPSGAPAMPGMMPMVSQSHAHSSDQSTVPQVLPMPLPNGLPLQGPSAVPGLPPSMPTMLHPIPFGYPPHPSHLVPPGVAMHVPFAPYPMLPSETLDPTARFQETGSPTNYTDESR